jgi:hypothetical protein
VVCVIDIFGHDHDHDHEENFWSRTITITVTKTISDHARSQSRWQKKFLITYNHGFNFFFLQLDDKLLDIFGFKCEYDVLHKYLRFRTYTLKLCLQNFSLNHDHDHDHEENIWSRTITITITKKISDHARPRSRWQKKFLITHDHAWSWGWGWSWNRWSRRSLPPSLMWVFFRFSINNG